MKRRTKSIPNRRRNRSRSLLAERLEDRRLLAVAPFHSNSGAPATLFLDFDGHFEPIWGSYSNVTSSPYDLDGDESTFNSEEQANIEAIWTRVAEDFAPFDIDVTTVEPPVLADGVPIEDANGVAMRVAIGPSFDGSGVSVTSSAYINAFTNSVANVAYVGISALISTAYAASHEAGHSFGLAHQSAYDEFGNLLHTYNPGQGSWKPIMGATNFDPNTASTWHDGPTPTGSTDLQDDMAILAGAVNGFGYRADDHANSSTNATALAFNGTSWTGAGIIETNDDVDLFSFTITSADTYRIALEGIEQGQNLDAVLELRDAVGSLVAVADPGSWYDAEILRPLAAGQYFLSAGKSDQYGAVGQYTVSVEPSSETDVPGWVAQLEGTGSEMIHDVAVDPDGNIYLSGWYSDRADFDYGPGTHELTSAGAEDAFVAKYTRDRELVWVQSLSGVEGAEKFNEIVLSPGGAVFVNGVFGSSTVDFGQTTLTNQGGNDAVAAKLDSNGNIEWIRSWGGLGNEGVSGLTVETSGAVLLSGGFEQTVDFDPSAAVAERTSQGDKDGYILQLDANGNYVSVMTFGGASRDSIRGIEIDNAGNTYASGFFDGTAQFGTSDGSTPVDLTSDGDQDFFLMRINSSGHTEWIEQITGDLTGWRAMGFDGVDGVYLTSFFSASVNFDESTLVSEGDKDVFLAKWNTNGDFQWAGQIGGPEAMTVFRLAFDSAANPYITGSFAGTADFDPGPGTHEIASVDGPSSYLLQLNTTGGFQSVQTIAHTSGTNPWYRTPVTIDDTGNVYMVTTFDGVGDFPTGDKLLSDTSRDTFLMKLARAPGITVDHHQGLMTSEAGDADYFTVELDYPPVADVTIDLSSSDPSEGTISPSTLTFTPSNWNVSQLVSVVGADDGLIDSDVDYTIITEAAVSTDPAYDGIDPADASVTNVNDDESISLFADSFESGQWNGLWVEDSQNDWFTSSQRSTDGNSSAEVDGKANDATLTVASPIDMSAYGSAELTFDWYIESGFDSGEYVKLEFFDGLSWNEILSLDGNVDQENVWHSETVQLGPQYLISDFQFRFSATANRPNEDANVDNVRLVAISMAGPPNQDPSADAGSAQAGDEDELLTFDASGSSDPDGDPLSYDWDFGDGQTAQTAGPTVSHSYEYGGTFNVTVTVDDGRGGQSQAATTANVTEVNDVPIADAGGSYSGAENSPISFDASGSSDFDNLDGAAANDQVLEYTWNFGDGNVVTTTDETVDHTYAVADTYVVSLTVSDGITSSPADVTSAVVSETSSNDPNTLYVYDIRFESKRRGRDWRAVFEIRSDSNADGAGSSADDVAAGVSIEVVFNGKTFTGTTDSNGVFRTNWQRKLSSGDYYANAVDLALTGYGWNPLDLDLEGDSDFDGLPDALLTL